MNAYNIGSPVTQDDPDEGQKLKRVGLTIKLLFILQVLLEFSPQQDFLLPFPCTSEVGEVPPEIYAMVEMNKRRPIPSYSC